MSLNLLGISRSRDVTGPHGGEVRWVAQGPLAAATLSHAPQSFGPLDHARLLATVHQQTCILPVRHGTVLPDEEAVKNFLGSRCKDLHRDLDRLEGSSEIGLRIELSHSPPPEGPLTPSCPCRADISPAAYLAARRARYQSHDELNLHAQLAVETCLQSLGGLFRDWRRLSPEPPGILRLAFLVERTRSDAFTERVTRLDTQKIAGRYTLVGPWPPYSFV